MNNSAARDRTDLLSRLAREFQLSSGGAREIIVHFHDEMRRGLAGEASSLKMLPAFVPRPRGTERGSFLALDLGGTNIRVLAASLDGNGRATPGPVSRFAIPRELTTGAGDALFDFLAASVGAFFHDHRLDACRPYDLAFAFSFPFLPLAVAAGRLLSWTKGFAAAGVEGQEVAALLRNALRRRGMENLRVAALVNDTVGTLAAGSYADPACDMGVILGTGTNACYPERAGRLVKYPAAAPEDETIVNIEWGNFDRLPANDYDRELDLASANPGRQRLEKMVSGMYLGELGRRIVLAMTARGLLFRGAAPPACLEPYAWTAEHMALASGDAGDFSGLGLTGAATADKRIVGEICRLVARRAARLAGTAIAAVVTWLDPALDMAHTVAIDGALFAKYPGFPEQMRTLLGELYGDRAPRIAFTPARDGSGIGAAIVAAVAAASRE